MITRIVAPGSKEVVVYDVLSSERFGFPPGTTMICEDHWVIVKDSLLARGIKETEIK